MLPIPRTLQDSLGRPNWNATSNQWAGIWLVPTRTAASTVHCATLSCLEIPSPSVLLAYPSSALSISYLFTPSILSSFHSTCYCQLVLVDCRFMKVKASYSRSTTVWSWRDSTNRAWPSGSPIFECVRPALAPLAVSENEISVSIPSADAGQGCRIEAADHKESPSYFPNPSTDSFFSRTSARPEIEAIGTSATPWIKGIGSQELRSDKDGTGVSHVAVMCYIAGFILGVGRGRG